MKLRNYRYIWPGGQVHTIQKIRWRLVIPFYADILFHTDGTRTIVRRKWHLVAYSNHTD